MISKDDFECKRCADCCKYLIVKLSKGDISRIREHYDEEVFLEYDEHIKADVLKRGDDGCVFLEGNDCKIYSFRPKVCRDYPFIESDKVESCKPDCFSKSD